MFFLILDPHPRLQHECHANFHRHPPELAETAQEAYLPLGSIVEFIVEPVIEAAIQLFGYGTAWLLVPVFTFGKVFVEPTPIREFTKPGLGKIQRSGKRNYVMDAELASLLGLLFWVAVALGVYALNSYT